jgi:hypothetical protein
MLVVDENEFIAGARIREADAARIARPARIGDPAHCALRRKFCAREREQMLKVFGRQASDPKAHRRVTLVLG